MTIVKDSSTIICRLRCSVVNSQDISLSEKGLNTGIRGPVLADLSKKVTLCFFFYKHICMHFKRTHNKLYVKTRILHCPH